MELLVFFRYLIFKKVWEKADADFYPILALILFGLRKEINILLNFGNEL